MATCQASWPMIPWGCSGAAICDGNFGIGSLYDTNKISLLGDHWQRKFGVISRHYSSDTMNTIGEYFRIFALHESLEVIPVIPHFQTDPQWGLSWSKRKWRINTMRIIVLIRFRVSLPASTFVGGNHQPSAEHSFLSGPLTQMFPTQV